MTFKSPAQFFAENQNIAGFDNVRGPREPSRQSPPSERPAPRLASRPARRSSQPSESSSRTPLTCAIGPESCRAACHLAFDPAGLRGRRPPPRHSRQRVRARPSPPRRIARRPAPLTCDNARASASEALTASQLDELRGLASSDRRDVDLYVAEVRRDRSRRVRTKGPFPPQLWLSRWPLPPNRGAPARAGRRQGQQGALQPRSQQVLPDHVQGGRCPGHRAARPSHLTPTIPQDNGIGMPHDAMPSMLGRGEPGRHGRVGAPRGPS